MATASGTTEETSLREPWSVAATFLLVTASVALATWTATSADSRDSLILVLAVVVGLLLGALALTRFAVYVQLLLIARASLDFAQLTAGDTDLSFRAIEPSSLYAVMFLIAGALWLSAQRQHQGHLVSSPVRRALVAFAAAGTLSMLGTSDLAATSVELLRILAAIMMFAVLEQMMLDPGTMLTMLRAVYLSAVFLSLSRS